MDELLKLALVGTAQANGKAGATVTAIDRAVAQLDVLGTEHRLLLAAGAHGIRRRAGVLPLAQPEVIDRAEDEICEVAPERVALLVEELLSGQATNLLPEALERLRAARLILPPALLPIALDTGARDANIRPALLAVVGNRGWWLARHNDDWSWATQPSDDELVEDADTIWQEGKQAERLNVLRIVRSRDPARGRAMLEQTWQRERASSRAEAIDLLRLNLSTDDQALLAQALEDRAKSVQERAEALLLHFPASRAALDAVSRAEPLIGKRLGLIAVRPPDDTASSNSERAMRMSRTLGRVPPSHWVAQLGKRPGELVKSIARDRDWGFAVLAGWTEATLKFGDAAWAEPLTSYWLAVSRQQLGMAENAYAGTFDATVKQNLVELLKIMEPGVAERVVGNEITGSFDLMRMAAVLPNLARPWSVAFTDRYLGVFHDLAQRTFAQAEVNWQVNTAWTASFRSAALAIPASSIQKAIALLSQLLESDQRQGTDFRWERWKQMLQSYIDTLQMRQRINEEIPA